MSIHSHKVRAAAAGNRRKEQYEASSSVRFDENHDSYLYRTPSNTGNQKKWTWAGWVKRNTLNTNQDIFGVGGDNNSGLPDSTELYFVSNNTLSLRDRNHPNYSYYVTSSDVFEDITGWYHIVAIFDTTHDVAEQRMVLYVNGVRLSSVSSAYPPQNHNGYVNGSLRHTMGMNGDGNDPSYVQFEADLQLADVYFFDGYRLGPDHFGEFDATGNWIAKDVNPPAFTIEDASDNNYKITVIDPREPVEGKYGWGMDFWGDDIWGGGSYQTRLRVPYSTDWRDLWIAEATVEFWIKWTDSSRVLNSSGYLPHTDVIGNGTSSEGFRICITNKTNSVNEDGLQFFNYGTGSSGHFNTGVGSLDKLEDGDWHHIAVAKDSSSTIRVFLDGDLIKEVSNFAAATGANGSTARLLIGADPRGSELNYGLNGMLDDIHIVKGSCLYTEEFTPPSTRINPTANTVLLLNGDQLLKNTDAVREYTDGIEFDGTTYVDLGDNMFEHPEFMTVSVWARTDYMGANYALWNANDSGNNAGFGITINGSGFADARVRDDAWSSGSYPAVIGTTDLRDNQWHHICFVYDGNMNLYVDGVLESTNTRNSTIWTPPQTMTIRYWLGTLPNHAPLAYPFYGSGKEWAMWNTALTSTEVAELYNDGVPYSALNVQRNNLMGYYPAHDVKNRTLYDASEADSSISFNGGRVETDLDDVSDYNTIDWAVQYWFIPGEDGGNPWAMGEAVGGHTIMNFYDGGGGWRLGLWGGDFGYSVDTVNLGTWNHFVHSYDYSTNKISTWLNGVFQHEVTVASGSYTGLNMQSGNLLYWGTGPGGNQALRTNMKEMAVWKNTTLDGTDVSNLWNSGVPLDARDLSAKEDYLELYHKATRSTGGEVKDFASDGVVMKSSNSGRIRIQGSNGASAELKPGERPFSISYWAATNSTNEQYVISSFDVAPYDGFRCGFANGGYRIMIGDVNGPTEFTGPSGQYNDNVYRHYTIVYNRTNAKVYVNGSLVNTHTISKGAVSPSEYIYLGASYTGTTFNYTGSFKQVAMWHKELSADEVSTLYNASGDALQVQDNLVSYWPLNENGGTLAGNAAANYNGELFNCSFGHAGQFVGYPVTWHDVPNGQVINYNPIPYGKNGFNLKFKPKDRSKVVFNGSSTYANVGATSQYVDGSVARTVSFWTILHNASASDDYWISMGNWQSGGAFFGPRVLSTGVLSLMVNGQSGYLDINSSYDISNIVHKPVFLTFAYDGNRSGKIYVNGDLVYSADTGAVLNTTGAYDVWFGGRNHANSGGGEYINATMWDVTIFNRDLGTHEIKQLMNGVSPNTVDAAACVGWWPMDEGGGLSIIDSSKWVEEDGAYSTGDGGASGIVAPLPAINTMSSACYSAWVKTTSTSGLKFLINGSSGTVYINRWSANGKVMAIFDGSSGNNSSSDDSAVAINDGRWHHCVFQNDGTTTYQYIDGVLSNSYTETFNYAGSRNFISFGGGGYGDDNRVTEAQFRNGCAWSNQTLTAQEVADLYANDGDPSVLSKTPDVFLKMNEGPGSKIVKDYSGNGYDGIVFTGAGWTSDEDKRGVLNSETVWSGYGIGNDSLGNNNWSYSNLDNFDILKDGPDNRFPQMNPLVSSADSHDYHRQGGLEWTTTAVNQVARSSMAIPSNGKYYAELIMTATAGGAPLVGITHAESTSLSSGIIPGAFAWRSDGRFERGGSGIATVDGFTTGDVLGILVDRPNDVIYFFKNGKNVGGMSQLANQFQDKEIVFACQSNATGTTSFLWNFGQDASFAGFNFSFRVDDTSEMHGIPDSNGLGEFYHPPASYASGYTIGDWYALCTKNLPNPNPKKHFECKLYDGKDGLNSINGLQFQPDLVIFKRRDEGKNAIWMDSIRGAGNELRSNEIAAQVNTGSAFTSFDDDGFTFNTTSATYNATGGQWVSYSFNAGGDLSTNTDGNVTSSVKANQDFGFSIAKWTGTGTNGHTMGHGLSKAPEIAIFKPYEQSYNWYIWSKYLTGNQYGLGFDTFAEAVFTYGNLDNIGSSTVQFIQGANGISNVNNSSWNYIGYFFHSVDGLTKIGTYVGNGSANGPYVNTGFKPSLVIIKPITGSGSWVLHDSQRSEWNPINKRLWLNDTNAESPNTSENMHFYADGFKHRGTIRNDSGVKYLYIAFADTPGSSSTAR